MKRNEEARRLLTSLMADPQTGPCQDPDGDIEYSEGRT